MPKGYQKAPGLKKIDVPCYRDDLNANQYDADASRGPLKNVPREPIYRTGDFGAPKAETMFGQATSSPASATFTAKAAREQEKSKRTLPETQVPQSIRAH